MFAGEESLPDGIKYHFAAVYLDELDMAGWFFYYLVLFSGL